MALVKCKECGEQISKKAAACPKCGAPAKKKTSAFTWLVTILLLLGVVGYFSGYKRTSTSSSSSKQLSPEEVALKAAKLEFIWNKIGFNNIMEATFTITNNSQYAIKDIAIECTHYAKSGTRIDSNKRTIFDAVDANSSKTF